MSSKPGMLRPQKSLAMRSRRLLVLCALMIARERQNLLCRTKLDLAINKPHGQAKAVTTARSYAEHAREQPVCAA